MKIPSEAELIEMERRAAWLDEQVFDLQEEAEEEDTPEMVAHLLARAERYEALAADFAVLVEAIRAGVVA